MLHQYFICNGTIAFICGGFFGYQVKYASEKDRKHQNQENQDGACFEGMDILRDKVEFTEERNAHNAPELPSQ